MTSNDLKRAAKQHEASATEESGGRWCVWQIEAPRGHVWTASETHVLRVEWHKRDTTYRIEAITDALERMAEGVDVCTNQDCDYCEAAARAAAGGMRR